MRDKLNANEQKLLAVATKLDILLNDVVFVGGCTTSLLVDKAAAPFVRHTDDVDFIVKVVHSYVQHANFEKQLRQLGFSNDPEGPTCR